MLLDCVCVFLAHVCSGLGKTVGKNRAGSLAGNGAGSIMLFSMMHEWVLRLDVYMMFTSLFLPLSRSFSLTCTHTETHRKTYTPSGKCQE